MAEVRFGILGATGDGADVGGALLGEEGCGDGDGVFAKVGELEEGNGVEFVRLVD